MIKNKFLVVFLVILSDVILSFIFYNKLKPQERPFDELIAGGIFIGTLLSGIIIASIGIINEFYEFINDDFLTKVLMANLLPILLATIDFLYNFPN